MISLAGTLFRMVLFATVVLVLGNSIKIGQKTVSDQVRVQMSHAERSEPYKNAKKWLTEIKDKAGLNLNGSKPSIESEEILSSERKKLRNLIDELNSGD